MSMYTYVEFGKRPDDKFKKYKEILNLCFETNVAPPQEVVNYFRNNNLDPEADNIWNQVGFDEEAIEANFEDGFDEIIVDVTKLPKDVTLIRFCNSY